MSFLDKSETEKQELMDLQIYKNLFTYKEKRMKFVEYDKFSKEFIWFTSHNGMEKEKQDLFFK